MSQPARMIKYLGQGYDLSDVRVIGLPGGNLLATHVREFTTDEKLDFGEERGQHPARIDTTLGDHSASAGLVVLLDAWTQILNELPDGYSTIKWQLTISLSRSGSGRLPLKIELEDAQILPVNTQWRRSKEGFLSMIPLTCKMIYQNGKSCVPKIIP